VHYKRKHQRDCETVRGLTMPLHLLSDIDSIHRGKRRSMSQQNSPKKPILYSGTSLNASVARTSTDDTSLTVCSESPPVLTGYEDDASPRLARLGPPFMSHAWGDMRFASFCWSLGRSFWFVATSDGSALKEGSLASSPFVLFAACVLLYGNAWISSAALPQIVPPWSDRNLPTVALSLDLGTLRDFLVLTA